MLPQMNRSKNSSTSHLSAKEDIKHQFCLTYPVKWLLDRTLVSASQKWPTESKKIRTTFLPDIISFIRKIFRSKDLRVKWRLKKFELWSIMFDVNDTHQQVIFDPARHNSTEKDEYHP
jgi:hypothetical protein